MLTRRIIPCLDVDDGRVVKGVRFENLRDAGDPAEIAALYDAQGADEITLLDVSASHQGRGAMLDVVARTAEQTFTPLTVGGGVREPGDVLALLNAGADKVAINTAAVAEPALIGRCAARFGRQAIVSAIDAKRTGDGWRIFTHGGRRDSGRDALRFAREVADLGAGEILLTSMDADGTQDGFDLELTRAVASTVPVPVIASGGAGKAAHLTAACLAGADAALAASIFHFGTVSIRDVREDFARAGLPVRFAGHADTAMAGTA